MVEPANVEEPAPDDIDSEKPDQIEEPEQEEKEPAEPKPEEKEPEAKPTGGSELVVDGPLGQQQELASMDQALPPNSPLPHPLDQDYAQQIDAGR